MNDSLSTHAFNLLKKGTRAAVSFNGSSPAKINRVINRLKKLESQMQAECNQEFTFRRFKM